LSPEKHTTAAPARTEQRDEINGKSPRAEVVDHRRSEPAERLDLDLLHKAERAEVRGMSAHDRAHAPLALGLYGALEVGQPRSIGRADLDQPSTRLRDHLGDPKRPPDLHELAAGHDDRTITRQCRGREQDSPRAVVDRHRRRGTGQLAEQGFDVRLTRPAHARVEVELEIGVALGHARERLPGAGGQRRAAEVGVHDHASGVDHPSQRWSLYPREVIACPRREVDLIGRARTQLAAPLLDRGAGGGNGSRVRGGAQARGQLLHGGQGTQGAASVGGAAFSLAHRDHCDA